MTSRRVFVTGMGVVSALGRDPSEAFEAAFAGRSAIRRVETGGDQYEAELPLAAVDFDPGGTIPKGSAVFMARAAQMAVVAADRALTHASVRDASEDLVRASVQIGCGLGGSEVFERAYKAYFLSSRRKPRPTTVPMIMASGPASHVSMHFGIRGPVQTHSVACASSGIALGEAFRSIRDGYVDLSVAGGAEAMLNAGSLAAWISLGALATEHPEGPEVSSRPFDAERTGFVLGEGAAVLILESEERVRSRGADPLAEIVGFGSTADAFNLTEPHADGQIRCMRAALADAGLAPEDVGYVNAHGTATPTGDPVEIEAMKAVFGAESAPPISSTKGVHGHLVGAAGALEAMLTVEALRTGRIPPTAHRTHPDPSCDLDCVPLVGRSAPDLKVALSNSFAFGGSNATLAFRRV